MQYGTAHCELPPVSYDEWDNSWRNDYATADASVYNTTYNRIDLSGWHARGISYDD